MDHVAGTGKNNRTESGVSASNQIARVIQAANRVVEKSSDFDLNPDVSPPSKAKLRPAAVLIPLLETPRGVQVLLTKRASGLKHHPGQIAFPGGAVDAEDANPQAAALREAWEEIGLAAENTEILGGLPNHQTVTGFSVMPVLARVRVTFEPKPEPAEVAEVFSVPLAHVTDLNQFQVHSRMWQGVQRYYDVVPYGPYYIWGATARMLRALAQGMQV